MQNDELVEKVARAASKPLANMRGGCFNPRQETRGECADGDCYCARVSKHVARAAIAVMREAGWKGPDEIKTDEGLAALAAVDGLDLK